MNGEMMGQVVMAMAYFKHFPIFYLVGNLICCNWWRLGFEQGTSWIQTWYGSEDYDCHEWYHGKYRLWLLHSL